MRPNIKLQKTVYKSMARADKNNGRRITPSDIRIWATDTVVVRQMSRSHLNYYLNLLKRKGLIRKLPGARQGWMIKREWRDSDGE